MIAFILVALLAVGQSTARTSTFRPLKKTSVSQELVLASCDDLPRHCWRRFLDAGRAWAGDVNNDGEEEIIIFPGTGGTGGDDAMLYQKRDGGWHVILDYFPYDDRFLILRKVRSGYRDLCLDVNHCFKWAGRQYAPYGPSDYRTLSLSALNTRNPREATLRWMARYADLSRFQFLPDWYEVRSDSDLGTDLELSKSSKNRVWAELEDPSLGVRWVSLFKGEVWAVKGNRAFLLLPRCEHKGAERLVIDGDWLIVLADRVVTLPRDTDTKPHFEIARFNRRTGSLAITTSDPFWLHKII